MFYCNSRYYVPEWCRWLNADHISCLNPQSIHELNLFAYCGNDPVNMVDPSGHFAISSFLISLAIGSFAGNVYMKYNPRYPGRNPNKIPDGFKDRPNPKANYYNPKTGQSLGPDLYHPGPIGPHWDWKDSKGQWWRLYRWWRIRK